MECIAVHTSPQEGMVMSTTTHREPRLGGCNDLLVLVIALASSASEARLVDKELLFLINSRLLLGN